MSREREVAAAAAMAASASRPKDTADAKDVGTHPRGALEGAASTGGLRWLFDPAPLPAPDTRESD